LNGFFHHEGAKSTKEDEEEKENKKMKLTVPKPLLPHAGEHSLMN
jgi:hypothetical protein